MNALLHLNINGIKEKCIQHVSIPSVIQPAVSLHSTYKKKNNIMDR